MLLTIIYTTLGYLSGSILFARVAGALLKKNNITTSSPDGNPGTYNAFVYGGFCCGVLTLIGDLLKGFLPVFLYLRQEDLATSGIGIIFVLIAPVVGHVFPLYYKFHGGKGIAVSFGVLLGLIPVIAPVIILAAIFIIFSSVVRITPTSSRAVWTYRIAPICMFLFAGNIKIAIAFLIISILVLCKFHFSKEEREPCKVSFF